MFLVRLTGHTCHIVWGRRAALRSTYHCEVNNDLSYISITAAVAANPDTPFSAESIELRHPGPHELLVQVVATGICHTDVMTKDKGLCEFPIVLGHEGVGIIEQIGEAVTDFAVGDHVIMTYDYCDN